MKKTILFIFFAMSFSTIKAQIFSNRLSDQSITITPKGIQSKFTNLMDYTNTALGHEALKNLNSGVQDNSAFGLNALSTTTVGIKNAGFGSNALAVNTTGAFNVAVGEGALASNTIGNDNTALGKSTLANNRANYRSTAVGYYAMFNADNRTVGRPTYNTAVGANALYGSLITANNTGQYNTAIGDVSMFSNTSGYENTGVGTSTLRTNSTGYENTAIGTYALEYNTTGNSNIAVGTGALSTNVANSRSTAIGFNAMAWADNRNIGRTTYNTAVGYKALLGSITLIDNSGQYNTAIGDAALQNNSLGNNNTAVGSSASTSNTTGILNTSIGSNALKINTSGSLNTVIGSSSLVANTVGDSNVVVGAHALAGNISGNRNTVIGTEAGFLNEVGTGNIFIGYQAGYNHNNDDVLVIENSSSNRALIRGDFAGNKIGINRNKTEIDNRTETFQVEGEAFKTTGTGNWIIPSDRRLKENIEYLSSEHMLAKVLKMNGVTFNWKDKSRGGEPVYGFIAQELREIFPNNVKEDKEGYLSASYGSYDPIIIESIKALKNFIDEQRKLLDMQTNKIKLLEETVNAISSKNKLGF